MDVFNDLIPSIKNTGGSVEDVKKVCCKLLKEDLIRVIALLVSEVVPSPTVTSVSEDRILPQQEILPTIIPTTLAGADGAQEKAEEDKICQSMWGKKSCDRETCKRKHPPICTELKCFGNYEARRECSDWHGHVKTAIRLDKARKKEEVQKRLFQVFLKKQRQGNGSRGLRGIPRKSQTPKTSQNKGDQNRNSHIKSRQQSHKKSVPRLTENFVQ
ncbi:Hypothetical protein FKW44_015434, partial [Caligus rogercresseyi]